MKWLLASCLLLAAPWVQGQAAAPTLGDALTDGDAATAEDIPAPPAQADEREATLLELEYRLAKMQSSRAKMKVVAVPPATLNFQVWLSSP